MYTGQLFPCLALKEMRGFEFVIERRKEFSCRDPSRYHALLAVRVAGPSFFDRYQVPPQTLYLPSTTLNPTFTLRIVCTRCTVS